MKSLQIENELHTVFKRLCEKRGYKMNKLVESLILKWLEEQAKAGN